MAASTPITTQETANKMQTFITVFDRVVARFGNREIAMLAYGFPPGEHPIPPGMNRPYAFRYAKFLIGKLHFVEKPCLLALEPLCKIPRDDVKAIGKENEGLLIEYIDKKKGREKMACKMVRQSSEFG